MWLPPQCSWLSSRCLGGDRFATIGGVIAIALGPIVYLITKVFLPRRAPGCEA